MYVSLEKGEAVEFDGKPKAGHNSICMVRENSQYSTLIPDQEEGSVSMQVSSTEKSDGGQGRSWAKRTHYQVECRDQSWLITVGCPGVN
jgi:hypothetical protein